VRAGGGFLSHLFSKACALIQALPLDRLLVVLAVAAAALGATKHPCREALAVPLEALGLDALATPGMLHQGLGGVQLGLREAGKVLAVGRLVDPDGLGLPDLGLEGVRGLLLRLGPRLVDHVGELDVVVAVVAVALWAAKLTPCKAWTVKLETLGPLAMAPCSPAPVATAAGEVIFAAT